MIGFSRHPLYVLFIHSSIDAAQVEVEEWGWTISATVVVWWPILLFCSPTSYGRVRFCLRPFAVSIAAYVAVLPGCQDPELCTHLVSTPSSSSSSYFDVRWKGEGGRDSAGIDPGPWLFNFNQRLFKSNLKLYCGLGLEGTAICR